MNLTDQPTIIYAKTIRVPVYTGKAGTRFPFPYDDAISDSYMMGIKFEAASGDAFNVDCTQSFNIAPVSLSIPVSYASAKALFVSLSDKDSNYILNDYPVIALAGFRRKGANLKPFNTQRFYVKVDYSKSYLELNVAQTFLSADAYVSLTIFYSKLNR